MPGPRQGQEGGSKRLGFGQDDASPPLPTGGWFPAWKVLGGGIGEGVASQREWGSLVGYGQGEMAWNVRNSTLQEITQPLRMTSVRNNICRGRKPTQNYIKADDGHRKAETYCGLIYNSKMLATTLLSNRRGTGK